MRRAIIGLALGCALIGCTTTWSNPTKGSAQFDQDSYACERDAYMTGGAVYTAGVAVPTKNRGMYERCMAARGYVKD